MDKNNCKMQQEKVTVLKSTVTRNIDDRDIAVHDDIVDSRIETENGDMAPVCIGCHQVKLLNDLMLCGECQEKLDKGEEFTVDTTV